MFVENEAHSSTTLLSLQNWFRDINLFASQGPFKDKTDMTDSYSSSLNAECYSLALSDETGYSSSCYLIEMQGWFQALVLEV